MTPAFLNKSQIPHKPGVYQFKSKDGRVIYVGKAIDLYHRVASYFVKYQDNPRGSNAFNPGGWNVKTDVLVEQIASVETIIVESELEALILEANLIKKYLPQFNVSLKDDKDYLYILITKEEFPKVVTARKQEIKNSLKYFGPFPSSRTVRDTLKALRRVFPWCSTRLHTGSVSTSPLPVWKHKACFYYHLGLCPGACVGKISKKDYQKNILNLVRLLEGKKDSLVNNLTKEMDQLSKEQRFEDAVKVKKILEGISYLTQTNRTDLYLENPNFLQDEEQKVLESLQKVLNLPKLPERIECYDISNIQGQQSTGSMVVLTNGEIDKSQYRKFKIHMTGRPNDVGMHREMMSRRLRHPEWPKPDLIIIDGGLGQVHAVSPIIHSTYYQLPVYGLAKRMEWLYSPNGTIIKLPKSHPASKLLQKIRDEAHRFAISYHRKLHRKTTFGMIKM